MATPIHTGVLAQLVERLNGIEEVRGSNPLGSMYHAERHLHESFYNNARYVQHLLHPLPFDAGRVRLPVIY